MTSAAVTAAEFGRLLLPLLNGDRPAAIAVAVSGGADSMALALLAKDWAAKQRITIVPLIVDHGLRTESAAEARRVAGWLTKAGLTPKILTWKTAKPSANRQAAAREARYALLAAECEKRGIRHLLVAHHRDDQAETLLLRSLRGSGVDGLAAMAPRRMLGGDLALLRPLLDLPKARLIATLQKRRQAWVEDPSNASLAFLRVRVRAALDLLSDNDATARAELVAHLAQTARNFSRTRILLEDAAYELLHRAVTLHPAGLAWLDAAVLATAGDELALRALSRLLAAIGGVALPPRLDGLERLLAGLRDGVSKPLTLHRCLIAPHKGEDRLLVCREARHLPAAAALSPGDSLWDGRFRVAVAKGASLRGVTLGPLGRDRPAAKVLPPDAPSASAWPGLPALRKNGELLAVPGLGWGRLPRGVTLAFHPVLPAVDAGGGTPDEA